MYPFIYALLSLSVRLSIYAMLILVVMWFTYTYRRGVPYSRRATGCEGVPERRRTADC